MTYKEMTKRIKDEMKRRNITQQYISEQTGICYCTINNWLRGKSVPKVNDMIILCESVGIELVMEKVKR